MYFQPVGSKRRTEDREIKQGRGLQQKKKKKNVINHLCFEQLERDFFSLICSVAVIYDEYSKIFAKLPVRECPPPSPEKCS